MEDRLPSPCEHLLTRNGPLAFPNEERKCRAADIHYGPEQNSPTRYGYIDAKTAYHQNRRNLFATRPPDHTIFGSSRHLTFASHIRSSSVSDNLRDGRHVSKVPKSDIELRSRSSRPSGWQGFR